MTINIAFTSYPRRITNCVKVINSVLEGTVLPDRIYLTLSHKEFPNYEQDLPQDLNRLIMTSNRVILNWVEENYKSMKKVFPILQYLEDDDIIIPIDDDMLIPKDMIESRLADFEANGCLHPISSNLYQSINMDNIVFSVYSLVQKKMLNGWQKFLTKDVLDTYNDDRTCLYLCHLNGYRMKPCTKWCHNPGNSAGISALPLAPRSDFQYKVGEIYDDAVADTVSKLSGGKRIGECFGLFRTEQEGEAGQGGIGSVIVQQNQTRGDGNVQTEEPPAIDRNIAKFFQYQKKDANIKHDLVYVLGRGSKHSNMEVKISITSMLKFCDDWIGDIYVVGENPNIHNKNVKHISAPDITSSNKDANIIYKLLYAINHIPTLTENFLFCSDDILVTKKSSWSDFQPRYVFEYNQNDVFRKRLYEESKGNTWDRYLLKTLDRFVGVKKHIYFYEPHIMAPINRTWFKKMCHEIDYTKDRNNIVMSLWFNWIGITNPNSRFDHLSVFGKDIPDLSNPPRHLTYNDNAFSVREFRERLVEIVSMEEFAK